MPIGGKGSSFSAIAHYGFMGNLRSQRSKVTTNDIFRKCNVIVYRDDQDPRRTKIHPVRDLAVCRRMCDGSHLVLHIKNIAKLDWFKVKFNTEKQLNAWKKRMRQVKEAWNEETYFQYLNQKSQLRCK